LRNSERHIAWRAQSIIRKFNNNPIRHQVGDLLYTVVPELERLLNGKLNLRDFTKIYLEAIKKYANAHIRGAIEIATNSITGKAFNRALNNFGLIPENWESDVECRDAFKTTDEFRIIQRLIEVLKQSRGIPNAIIEWLLTDEMYVYTPCVRSDGIGMMVRLIPNAILPYIRKRVNRHRQTGQMWRIKDERNELCKYAFKTMLEYLKAIKRIEILNADTILALREYVSLASAQRWEIVKGKGPKVGVGEMKRIWTLDVKYEDQKVHMKYLRSEATMRKSRSEEDIKTPTEAENESSDEEYEIENIMDMDEEEMSNERIEIVDLEDGLSRGELKILRRRLITLEEMKFGTMQKKKPTWQDIEIINRDEVSDIIEYYEIKGDDILISISEHRRAKRFRIFCNKERDGILLQRIRYEGWDQ